jgi:hypothetical protein
MTIMGISKLFSLLLASFIAFAGPGNFKNGDTWEYEYQKISNLFPNTFHSIDTIIGKISFSFDSISKTSDTVIWYISRQDQLKIRSLFTSYYTSSVGINKDTTYLRDSAYQQRFAFVNNGLATLPSQTIPFLFFYYSQHADSFAATSSPVSRSSSNFSRKTSLMNVSLGTQPQKMFSQTLSYASSKNGTIFDNINTTISWLDSIGTYLMVYDTNSADQMSNSYSTTHEHYRLEKYNGIPLNLLIKR